MKYFLDGIESTKDEINERLNQLIRENSAEFIELEYIGDNAIYFVTSIYGIYE